MRSTEVQNSNTIFRGLSHLLAAFTTTSSHFERDWERLMAQPSSSDPIQGCWEGEWVSNQNQHRGKLRGVFSRFAPCQYVFCFRATYWKHLSFCSEVKVMVQDSGGGALFHGESNLGRLAGGIYKYDGKIENFRFVCSYHCKYDHGTFQLQRVH